MLEVTIVLEILVHKRNEALIIGGLLLFNSALSFFQEHEANRALALLRNRLSVRARVRRDGQWQTIPAEEVVPGDILHLRLGDLAPADIRLSEGNVQVDESELSGESLPVEKETGAIVYAGSRLQRGEATGEVTATGQHTYFGRTAELVKTASPKSQLQQIIFTIVKYMVAVDAVLVAALLLYAGFTHMPWVQVIPFALILLVASVPVALPTTFTVASALGGLEMSRRGVLVTRLSAIEEAAAMDVLCTDKTGTIMKTFEIGVFLSVGVMVSRTFIITPLLVVLLLFTNDFVTMAIATDRVSASSRPDRWNIRTLMFTAGALAVLVLTLSFSVFFVGRDVLHLPLGELQTLVFLMLVFSGQGNIYLVRERNRFWHSRPSRWLILSSVADVTVVSLFASRGIWMSPVPLPLIASLFCAIALFLFLLDIAKVQVFRYFDIR